MSAGIAPEDRTVLFGRLCVIEFYNRTQYVETPQQFTEALAREVAGGTDGTDVVVVRRADLPSLQGRDPLQEGRVPLELIADVHDACQADAFVLGSIDAHNPYWQPSVTVTVKVFDADTGDLLFSRAQGWDASSSDVQKKIKEFYEANRERDECRFGPELFATSPRYFLVFVAHAVARDIIDSL